MSKVMREVNPSLRNSFVDEGSRVVLYDDFGKFTAQGEMWHDWMNHSGIERYTVEQFKEQFELLGENFGKPLDSIKKGQFHLQAVIRRKSDDKLFGFGYRVGSDNWIDDSMNGEPASPSPNGFTHGIVYEGGRELLSTGVRIRPTLWSWRFSLCVTETGGIVVFDAMLMNAFNPDYYELAESK